MADEEAIADYDETIRLDPNNAEAYRVRAAAKFEIGRYEQAVADYDQAIRLNPNDAEAYRIRAAAKVEIGRYEQAFEDFDEAIRLAPNIPEEYLGRGFSKDKLDKYQEALDDYSEALRLDPSLGIAYSLRGDLLAKLGRYQAAYKDREQAKKLEVAGSQSRESPTITERPNQEALLKALNIYLDAMRPFILSNLTQAYGARGLKHAITEALGDEQATNFERDLDRNEGNIEDTLDAVHFRPIVEHHWDDIFFAKFGYDQSMLGTLGWITRARNEVAHPGTTDISEDDAQQHFSNILKTLDRIDAPSEQRNAVQSLKDTLGGRSYNTLQSRQLAYSTYKCTGRYSRDLYRCAEGNVGSVDASGEASIVCKKCSARYIIVTAKVLSVRREFISPPNPSEYRYTIRTERPNGHQELLVIYHDNNDGYDEDLVVDRGDVIVTSWLPEMKSADSQNGELRLLHNTTLDKWWDITRDVSSAVSSTYPGAPANKSGCAILALAITTPTIVGVATSLWVLSQL